MATLHREHLYGRAKPFPSLRLSASPLLPGSKRPEHPPAASPCGFMTPHSVAAGVASYEGDQAMLQTFNTRETELLTVVTKPVQPRK